MQRPMTMYNRELKPEDVYTGGNARIHHNNCTWCKHRRLMLGAKSREIELCSLTGKAIPIPFTGDRYCESYKQIGCECKNCNS